MNEATTTLTRAGVGGIYRRMQVSRMKLCASPRENTYCPKSNMRIKLFECHLV